MNNIPRFHMERYVWANQRRRFRQRVVTALASVVVFCTTYALILPAITLEHRCGMEEHVHSDACYTQVLPDTQQKPICGLVENEEHTHTDICYASSMAAPDTLTCTITDETHVHSLRCYGTWELTCPLPEHVHTDDCFSEAEPLSGEVQTQAATLSVNSRSLTSGKVVTYQVWRSGIWQTLGSSTYHTGTVGNETRAYIDVATATSFFETYGYTAGDTLSYSYDDIYSIFYGNNNYCIDVNSGTIANNTAIQLYESNGTSAQKFRIWELNGYSVISPLSNSNYSINLSGGEAGNGKPLILWCSVNDTASRWKVVTDATGTTTFASAVNENFLIDLPSGDVTNGKQLQVWENGSNSKWRLVQQYDEQTATYGNGRIGLTPESNGSIVVRYKPSQTSANTPTVIPSASTSEFIELNLYDYNGYINANYKSDNKYPGFQWNGGAYMYKSTFNRHSVDYIDFGNSNITDFSYGGSSSTNGKSQNAQNIGNQGGDINALDISDYGVTNRPIGMSSGTEVLSRTLKDGYPALADGTSLAYLFQNGTAVKKQNTQSIDGLFQKSEFTGEYYYNSRWNHAQYGNNKFTLYEQAITPNFIVYPFGNFLPFNDITNSSAATQVGSITNVSDYVEGIQKNMAGSLSESPTKTQLNTMLEKYQTDINSAGITDAKSAITDYFTAGGGSGDKPSNNTTPITDDLLRKLYNIDWDEETNFFFGMEMKMNLMQPKGGLTGKDGKQPMTFYFTGDDDVWVYIDDVLFLDLSGIHRHVGGEIDFVNGVVNYYALDVFTGDVSETPYKTYTFKELLTAAGKSADGLNDKGTFADYSHHTFNFYYMERGSGSSVCRMNFNFPLLKKNSISVTKELSVNDESKLALLGDPDFKFQVLKEGGNDLFIGDGVSYELRDTAGNTIGSGITDANGVFTLKANQTAVFSDIKENSGKYFVRELLDTTVFEQYGTIEVNGSSQTTSYDVTVGSESFKGVNSPVKDMSDGSTVFRFNNHVDITKLGSLSITKTLTAYPKARALSQFEFEVRLDGTPLPVGTTYTVGDTQKTVEDAGIIVLAPGETAVITGILAGSTFTVQETAASAEGYIPSYSVDGTVQTGDSASGMITAKTTVTVVINNAEKGAEVQIPVQKLLEFPDGTQHTYAFTLTQVTAKDGQTSTDPAFSKTLTVDITNDPVNAAFEISYAQTELNGLPQTFYYRITEDTSADEAWTIFDTSVYVAEVTISETDGQLSADVTALWKDGQETDTGQMITFTNTIARYELPETGGTGTRWYTMGGLSLLTLVGLTYKRRRRKGAAGHS